MNQQEAFDKAAVHLLTQGKKSYLEPVTPLGVPPCAYRSDDGLKCAIGALIPDEEYSKDMEKMSVTVLLRQDFCPDSLKGMNKDFLQGLQETHDEAHGDGDVEEFRRNLLDFAAHWKLDTKVITEWDSAHEHAS